MRIKFLLTIFTILIGFFSNSQSANCSGMEPICTDVGLTFDAQTGVPQAQFTDPGNNYGCLFSQPNPTWYYLEIATNGNIDMSLWAPSDIDFIIYGPYSSLGAAQADCNNMGAPASEIIDCSYSSTNNETPSIPNAIAGQVYVMLITNYANVQQQIILTQTGGAGSTDCSIVNPTCFINNFTANISPCEPGTDTYDITGVISFVSPPASGDLVVEDCNGNIYVVDSYPFPASNTVNYTINNLPANGSNCDLITYFTNTPSCSLGPIVYTSPSGCTCNAAAGTFSQNTVGNTNSIPYDYNLCFGDQLNITANGDYTPPQDFNINGITYDPGMWLLVYSCPPTLITPNTINNDPCLIGVYSTNDQSWNITNNTGDGLTYYFVPVTMYSMVNNTYAISINNGEWCYDLGQLYTVTFLPQLTINAGPDQTHCFGQTTSTLTASGANTYVWSGGLGTTPSITVSPSVTTTYTVNGTSINGCTATDQVVVNVNGLPNVNAGPDQIICNGDPVTLNSVGATTYSWDNGVTNGATFYPPSTTTYTVTGTNANGCINTDQVVVTVNPLPIVNAGIDVVVCEDETITLTGSGADLYSWDNNISNGVSFIQNNGTTIYTVVGTTLAGCTGTDQVQVTVISNPTPNFLPNITNGCVPISITFTNNTQNINDCVWSFSNGQSSTDCNPTITFTQGGCYDVMLTTTNVNGCIGTTTFTNLICVEDNPEASFIPSSGDVSTLGSEVEFTNTSTGASTYTWIFGDGSQITNVINPTHIFPDSLPGEYQVTLIAYSPTGCVDTAWTTITVYEELIYYVPNTFTPDGDNFNPTWKPIFTSGFDIYDYNLQIYNRWGEVIFESNNYQIGWDGSYGSNGEIQMCQDGVYVWRVELKLNRWDERRVIHGHVNLIR